MAKERVQRPARQMKPLYIVFCEGETESNYVSLLRLLYDIPIKVISKIIGQQISQALIDRHVSSERISKDDDISSFVMYDLDDPNVANQLNKCKATKLTSNPCIELWFLLHEFDQRAAIDTNACITKLRRVSSDWSLYAKGTFSKSQEKVLREKAPIAVERAKFLSSNGNPSSTVYQLIEKLETAIKQSRSVTKKGSNHV